VAAYFADTSFWIALSSKRDQYHSQAIAWHAVVTQSGNKIVTTEAVLWEWLNALADTTSRAIAAEGYRRAHADSRVEVVSFGRELNGAAADLYRSRGDKDWSLTDCLSFVVMERRRLTEALTTDHHFEQAGLKALMLSLSTATL
jgi:predicted nucleic acid-binding protein